MSRDMCDALTLRRLTPCAALLAALVLVACACPPKGPPSNNAAHTAGTVLLDGARMEVKWSDGDTFRIKSGAHNKKSARLAGFNTLEDYGPVHRWGTWTPQELFDLARAPESFLSARSWTCTSSGKEDKYKRLLVDCREVAEALIGEGLAMVFAIDAAPDARLLELQREAQRASRGMWKKGVPAQLVTSLHSAAEGRGYNRTVDTATGIAAVREHQETYQTCQEVCEGPAENPSCMRYVPYESRYKNKPDCLR